MEKSSPSSKAEAHMKHFSYMIFIIPLIIISVWFQAYGTSAPIDVSSLGTVKGYLIAGTFTGKVFASQDSGLHWSDVSNGLCDSSSLRYQKMIKCINVTGNDSIHIITACGEYVSTVPDFHWKEISGDSCLLEYCPGCLTNMRYSAHLDKWIIRTGITGPIEWSPDSGKTWTVSVSGCSYCSMPIILSIHFDTISALAGLYSGYGSMIGYSSGIIMSIDSGKTWQKTGFAPVASGVRSITRMGSIAFAGTEKGIYASRDNFTTYWLLGESASVKKCSLPERDMTAGNDGVVRDFAITGKLLRHIGKRYGNQVVIEHRTDAKGRYVKKIAAEAKPR
jgi:hypothetical protein